MGKIAVLFAVLCTDAGCTVVNTYRFRVVDASDGHPIAGVQAEGDNDRYEPGDFYWPTLIHSRHHFTVSDPDGLAKFDSMGEHEIRFQMDGYEPCTVVADSPGYKETGKLIGRRTFTWEDERTALIELQPCKRE